MDYLFSLRNDLVIKWLGSLEIRLEKGSGPIRASKTDSQSHSHPPYQVVVSCTHPKDEEDEIGNACTNSLKKSLVRQLDFKGGGVNRFASSGLITKELSRRREQ